MSDNENYFDRNEEDAVLDAYWMMVSEETDYETIADVIKGETIYTEHALKYHEERITEE